MGPHGLPWHRRAQFRLGHRLFSPFYRLFNRIPWLEYGLASPTVTRIECRHPPLAGRRAVQISDLHLDQYLPRHDAVLKTIAALKPDWIFITGDMLNVPEGIPHLFRFLSGLRGISPVYLTLGNHDHLSGVPVDRFAELADRHKLSLLINQTAFVTVADGELGVIGLDDPTLHRADVRCIPARVAGRFTVLLAHAPVVLDLLDPTHAVDLVLCGHSHGGQWRLPFIPTFWLPYGCHGRTEGEFFRNGQRLYVNRGLGWSLLPVRFRCPPEIVLVEWKDEPDENETVA
jgi:hypothetical protein